MPNMGSSHVAPVFPPRLSFCIALICVGVALLDIASADHDEKSTGGAVIGLILGMGVILSSRQSK